MRHVFLVVVFLTAAAVRAASQTPAAPLPLTLDDAVRRALETSQRVAEAVARGQAVEAVADQRHAALLPQIAAQAGYTRTNHVEVFGVPLPNNQLRIIYPDIPDNYRTRLDLQWPIYTGGRLAAIEQASRIDARAASAEPVVARADVRLDVTRAYWALVTAIESMRVVDESLTRIAAHLRDVRNQLAVGLVAPNDVLNVEAQESRQRMLSIQASSNRDVAEADVVRQIGAAPGTVIEPMTPLESPAANETPLAALLEAARQNRPERKALVDRVEAAGQRVQAAAAGGRPTIGVAGGVDYARPNPRIFPREAAWAEAWDASINLTWSIFDGGRTRAETAEASASVRAAQARLADFDAALAVELRQRTSELQASRAAIAAADDGIRAATEARRVAGERFTVGVSTSTDVLDAQIVLLQTALDRTQAMANARLAEARLARAVGRQPIQ